MKSELDKYSINEEKSRLLISQYCLDNSWKYRKVEWDNDIDGEIELFNKKKITTAKFIKVQLKTVDNPEKFKNLKSTYNYDASVKFVNFCDVCDIPIILVVFNIHEEKGYFVFVQKYIYNFLDKNNSNWRNNNSNVRIKIPLENTFSLKKTRTKLEEIAFNGTDLISQLRKTETSKKYYSVVTQSDNSHNAALRTSLVINVEKSFSTSKDAMRILIPKIHNDYISKVYHQNNNLAERFKGNQYDVMYMFFYNSVNQEKNGLSFCRTLWVRKNIPLIGKPYIQNPDEKVNDINIYWEDTDKLDSFIESNMLSKGEYIPFIDNTMYNFSTIYKEVLFLKEQYNNKIIDESGYIYQLDNLSSRIEILNKSIYDKGFPPNECKDLDIKLKSIICYLDNIRVVISDKKRNRINKLNCIRLYIRELENNYPEYLYERKKVK